jgi:hypothetical protein
MAAPRSRTGEADSLAETIAGESSYQFQRSGDAGCVVVRTGGARCAVVVRANHHETCSLTGNLDDDVVRMVAVRADVLTPNLAVVDAWNLSNRGDGIVSRLR